jgi:hypothetical protein
LVGRRPLASDGAIGQTGDAMRGSRLA